MSLTKCPKCHYLRQPTDTNVHAGICPACGIAYQKWLDKQSASQATEHLDNNEDSNATLLAKIQTILTAIPEKNDWLSFQMRCLILAASALWSIWFLAHGIDAEIIGGSFMHNVILPFHEFGHVFFGSFGKFMAILGGSLFQILMPLILMVVFIIQQRDNFAGALMLWWCGESFVDLSPYIRDAEYRVLPLVGGASESSHDWGNLLMMLDAVNSCYTLAKTSFALGTMIMLLGICWGAYILFLQYRALQG